MLTVVTFTSGNRPELLQRCVLSVENAKVKGVKHLILPTKLEDFNKTKVNCSKYKNYVAFVDDDDTIHKDALKYCLAAAEDTKAGIIVTNEIEVTINGTEIRKWSGKKTYDGASIHPRIIHHLCLIRADLIDPIIIDIANKYGVGVDWFIKASVARLGGAVHIPFFGYNWTIHNNMSLQEKPLFQRYMFEMGQEIRERWPHKGGIIPTWNKY